MHFQLDLEAEEYFCKTEKKLNKEPSEESNKQSPEQSHEKTIREARKHLANFKFNVDLTGRAIGLLDSKNVRQWCAGTDFVVLVVLVS